MKRLHEEDPLQDEEEGPSASKPKLQEENNRNRVHDLQQTTSFRKKPSTTTTQEDHHHLDKEEEEEQEPPLPQEKEIHILHNLQTHLRKQEDLNQNIEKRLFETQKQYYTVYMEKLMHQIPMGKDLVTIIMDRAGTDEFEYMFTAAKSVIQSQMRVKQIRAFHAVFDMVSGLVWRYVHEKVVTPTLSNVMSSQQLQLAYKSYQCCSKAEEEPSIVELQCLLYCIQEMLENEETVKIPNPLYSRLTQQMKAMSDYVIALLVSMAKPDSENMDPKECHIIKEKKGIIKEETTNEEATVES